MGMEYKTNEGSKLLAHSLVGHTSKEVWAVERSPWAGAFCFIFLLVVNS